MHICSMPTLLLTEMQPNLNPLTVTPRVDLQSPIQDTKYCTRHPLITIQTSTTGVCYDTNRIGKGLLPRNPVQTGHIRRDHDAR